jgi:hypothetical protein
MDIQIPKYKEGLRLNEAVNIQLPASVWLQFLAAYAHTEWHEGSATIIAMTIRSALLDPIFMNEQDAQYQEQRDMVRSFDPLVALGIVPPPAPDDDPRMDKP